MTDYLELNLSDKTDEKIRIEIVENPTYTEVPVARIRRVETNGHVRQGPDIPLKDIHEFIKLLDALLVKSNLS